MRPSRQRCAVSRRSQSCNPGCGGLQGDRDRHRRPEEQNQRSISNENPIKILVSGDLVVSAVFQKKKKYSLAINIQGLGSVEKEIVNTNTLTNDDSFADGTVIKLTPIPKKDESFFIDISKLLIAFSYSFILKKSTPSL